MSGSLYTALSALNAHQGWLDVIGNNLANTNTPGFKSASASFGDAFSRSLQPAMRAGKGGGTNPMQIGGGVAMGAMPKGKSVLVGTPGKGVAIGQTPVRTDAFAVDDDDSDVEAKLE